MGDRNVTIPWIGDPDGDEYNDDYHVQQMRRVVGILSVHRFISVVLHDKAGGYAVGMKIAGKPGALIYCNLHKQWEYIRNIPAEPASYQNDTGLTLAVPPTALHKPRIK